MTPAAIHSIVDPSERFRRTRKRTTRKIDTHDQPLHLTSMCNLYRMTKAPEEAANLSRTTLGSTGNFVSEVYPGYPGLVVANDELRSMVWGFPLTLKSKKTGQPLKPKPVNNARADKLESFMWRYSFAERRCLIPVTKFAEAEGEKSKMTRTWFSLPDQDTFAVAGIWRDTEEWGAAYSMVMTEACVHVADVHDRMPVVLQGDVGGQWVDGSPEEARALCQPYPAAMTVDRTSETWNRG